MNCFKVYSKVDLEYSYTYHIHTPGARWKSARFCDKIKKSCDSSKQLTGQTGCKYIQGR